MMDLVERGERQFLNCERLLSRASGTGPRAGWRAPEWAGEIPRPIPWNPSAAPSHTTTFANCVGEPGVPSAIAVSAYALT